VPHRGGIRKCGYGEGLQGQFKFVHSFCSENQAGFLSALRKNLSRVFRAAQCESRVLTLEEAEKDQGIHIDRSDIVGRKRIRISELWSGGIGTVLYYPRNLDVIHEMVEARSESKRFFSYMELCDKLSDPVVIGPRQAGIMYVGDYGDMVSVHSSPAETPLWRTDIEKSNRNLFDYEALS